MSEVFSWIELPVYTQCSHKLNKEKSKYYGEAKQGKNAKRCTAALEDSICGHLDLESRSATMHRRRQIR